MATNVHPLAGCPYCDANLECTSSDPYEYECERCGLELEPGKPLVDPRPN